VFLFKKYTKNKKQHVILSGVLESALIRMNCVESEAAYKGLVWHGLLDLLGLAQSSCLAI